jgi:tetratricopeptide (TPR) repeat protein
MSNAKINLVRFMGSSRVESPASPVARGVPLDFYFLSSKIQSLNDLIRRLARAAEIAYGTRDIVALDEISRVLTSIPLAEATTTGQYYHALIAKRRGKIDQAGYELEQLLTYNQSPVIQARAALTLGTVYESQSDIENALRLYLEAACRATSIDLFTMVCTRGQLSAIKSTEGDHRAALADLEQLWPLLRLASRAYPHLFYLYHNDLAYELAQVGRIEEARQHSEIAISSPLAPAYPEWLETGQDLARQLERPAQVFVSAPQPEQKPQAKTAAEVIVITGDLHTQQVASTALTRDGLQPPALIKPFRTGPPTRAPPFIQAPSSLNSM